MKKVKYSDTGFTIIELLIATAIFSVILVTMSAAIVQISRMFYKGITASHTQEVARTILNEVAQSAKFDPAGIQPGLDNRNDPNTHAFCIGNIQYSYQLGVQLGSANGGHALVRSKQPGCVDQFAQDVVNGPVVGQELLGNKMRLAKFDISNVDDPVNRIKDPDLIRITVRVVYGDDDLLCDADRIATCDTTTPIAIGRTPANLRCKNVTSGTQFCAMAELSTIVERRIN